MLHAMSIRKFNVDHTPKERGTVYGRGGSNHAKRGSGKDWRDRWLDIVGSVGGEGIIDASHLLADLPDTWGVVLTARPSAIWHNYNTIHKSWARL